MSKRLGILLVAFILMTTALVIVIVYGDSFLRSSSPCEDDRDATQAALRAYHSEQGEWPTADGGPGDIEWDKMMPGFIDEIPINDYFCDWQVNSNPEGEVCLWLIDT
jgi:hypothetical protein